MRVGVIGLTAMLMAGVALPSATLAQARAAAPATRPAATVAEVIRGVDLPFETFTLPNGLRVILHTDRKAPVVSVGVWFNVGSKDEPAGRTGFAHLFEHLMFSGTENVANPTEVLRDLGATDRNGSTWFDRTNYFQTVPTAALERTIYLESQRMGHLLGVLTQERLDNQRGVVQNEKRQGDNQPYGLVEYAQLEALFPEGHPYRHSTIGSMADLDAATLATASDWFRTHYGPNNAILILSGDVTAATARPLVERWFGGFPRGPQNTPAAAPIPTLPARVDQVMQDRVANTRLYRNWVVPGTDDEATVPLNVAADILGGLASSRLDGALVRGDATAVGVDANVQEFQRVSLFEVTVDVRPGADADAVSQRLDAIIADFIAHGPTADEVQRAAMRTASRTVQRLESVTGGQAALLAEGALYHNDPGYFRRELARYASVTPAQVQAAAQRWLSRPVYALRVNPGAREAYAESSSTRPNAWPPAARPATATPAAAPATPAAAMPAIGQVADLDFPTVERARLSNGMEVVYARRPALPVTSVVVEFDAGSAADRADRLGEQRLALDLMTEGAAGMDAQQLAEARERLGASLFANGSLDRSVVGLQTVSANLDPSIALLANVVRQPTYAPSEVERLRRRQLASIAQERSQPNGIAARTFPALIYGEGHPYSRPGAGTPETVGAITRDDLVAFQAAWLRPDNARIYVVSDRPLAEVTGLLNARFGDWRAPATARGTKTFPADVPAPTPRIVLIDRPQSPQSLIYAGQVLPLSGHDDVLTLNAANEILANNFLSRINTDIRETRGWSYGVRGNVQLLEHRLPYILNAPVQADRTGEALAAMIADYRAFRTNAGVTPAERDRTVNGSARQLAGQFETSAAVLGALRSNQLLGRPDNYWETVGPRYRTMTAAQMDAAARAAIDPDRFVWVVVGDAATIRPQLERLGLPIEVRQPG